MQTTQNVITDINEHLHQDKPEPIAIIENIVREKAGDLFPEFHCNFSANICHSIYIWGSFDKRIDWPGGYRENSRMFAAHVFCASQWYKEHPNQYFRFEQAGSLGRRIKGRMIARKDADPVKLANYIVKQLTKLYEANKPESI